MIYERDPFLLRQFISFCDACQRLGVSFDASEVWIAQALCFDRVLYLLSGKRCV